MADTPKTLPTDASVPAFLAALEPARRRDEAQAIAIERFKAKALEVSKGFGFSAYTLREVIISANDQGGQPRPRVMAAQARGEMAESAVPVEVGKTTVLINVSGSVQMR